MVEASTDASSLVEITSEIVSAFVSKNSIPASELPALMKSVHDTLAGLGSAPAAEAAPQPLKPAVPIRKSVTDEYIISLEDGRKFRSMKRYLAGLGMTPAQYRIKWGLPVDYPMVAPVYAAKRSELAKASGLGALRRKAAPEPEPKPEASAPAPKRGRKKAA